MNNRIFSIMSLEFQNKNLKLEEQLETILNDRTIKLEEKIIEVNTCLKNLVLNELAYNKFQQLITTNNENKNETNG